MTEMNETNVIVTAYEHILDYTTEWKYLKLKHGSMNNKVTTIEYDLIVGDYIETGEIRIIRNSKRSAICQNLFKITNEKAKSFVEFEDEMNQFGIVSLKYRMTDAAEKNKSVRLMMYFDNRRG